MDRPAADPGLDRAVLAELRAGIAPEALLAVIDTFEADIPQRISEIRSAAREGDGGALGDAAHMLKGASATLGAAHVAQLSGQLEKLARAGELRHAAALADEVALAVQDTPAALREELGR